MREATNLLLSDYVLRQAALEDIRKFLEEIDWDSANVPEDERQLLLGIEARLTGFDEGFNDEEEIRDFIRKSIALRLALSGSGVSVFVGTAASNEPHVTECWTDLVRIRT